MNLPVTTAFLIDLTTATKEKLLGILRTLSKEYPENFLRLALELSPNEATPAITLDVVQHIQELTQDDLIMVLWQMAELFPHVVFNVTGTAIKVSFTHAELKELNKFEGHQKVQCIKYIRQTTGIGFKEAKDLCEEHFVTFAKSEAWHKANPYTN